ncbi:hypothetical protein PR003_g8290 [Phytophthora rubi]|uniref:Secreted protein n=1 Tax=Phytophthora rubi TaxID=129364 RepID=A0A6A3N8L7_9STRA|nr:hypothetical protein PR002_g8641 [Phytophthora rubi]KAE9039775.1 hypothetical protein PR001_g7370 [Phytophthora rubi]KAE9344773.1 hypothetical protein PR003_g8290 [Phytophthora rubi]
MHHPSFSGCFIIFSISCAIATPSCRAPVFGNAYVRDRPNSRSWKPNKCSREMFCHTSDRKFTSPPVVLCARFKFSVWISRQCCA